MAATKSNSYVLSDVTMTAGAGNVTTSGPDVSGAYGSIALIKFTNGTTGPTVAGQVDIQLSGDTTNWYSLTTVLSSLANSAVVSFPVLIPMEAKNVRFVSGSNTGQNVTLRIEVTSVTAL